ncbi:hypothetical protein CCYA_CCYA01G0116 [Cyanidiococcus yangmingshanensis]|nr:hypothetical protein CCYA_CCYA01G0116 [Cyanidiococcus yangmingshanensis]
MASGVTLARWLPMLWRRHGCQLTQSRHCWRPLSGPSDHLCAAVSFSSGSSRWPRRLSSSYGNTTHGGTPPDETSGASGTSASLSDENPLRLENRRTGATVHVLGTAHISALSVQQTRELIQQVKPDTVVLELDDERIQSVRERLLKNAPNQDASLFSDLLRVFTDPRGGSLGSRMFEVYFKLFYRTLRMAGFLPGAEFAAAIEEAERLDAQIVLGDRNIHETMERLRTAVTHHFLDVLRALMTPPPPELEHLFGTLMERARGGAGTFHTTEFVDALLDRKSVRLVTGFLSSTLPAVSKVMLDERDVILASAIASAPGQRVVAIVGAAHLDGIERWWQTNRETGIILSPS